MIGLIAGTGFSEPGFLGETKERVVKTKYGTVYASLGNDYVYVPRHGKRHDVPAHLINHRANIAALQAFGVSEVIAATSVGSLRKDLPPGSIVIPDDYMQLTASQTFCDSKALYITPSLDAGLRDRLIGAADDLGIKVRPQGVYFQTNGPRLETRSEIRFIKDYADVIGMTMASEATLSKEAGLRYAAISQVDNYANGIVGGELDFSRVSAKAKDQRQDMKKILVRVIKNGVGR